MAINNMIPSFGLKVQITKNIKMNLLLMGEATFCNIAKYMYEYFEPADNFTLF